MPHVIIYTDGGAAPNPGLGGWAAVLYSPEHDRKLEIYGAEPNTTNNRMELLAAIKALKALKFSCEVDLHTDSSYLHNAFNKGWLKNWQKNNWRTSTGAQVLNQDLWQELIKLTRTHKIKWHWVKGHADDEINNRCDELVQIAREEFI